MTSEAAQLSLAEKPNGWPIFRMNFFPAAVFNHTDSHLNALQKKAPRLLMFHLCIALPIIERADLFQTALIKLYQGRR